MKHLSSLLILPAVIFFACSPPPDADPANESAGAESVNLFDGTSLDGWQNFGGGNFYVEDGAIVGEAAPGLPNSFLATNETYGDFELEVEFKIDPLLNSGIQIRSQIVGERLRGWQVEIDPSQRSWSGGLYDEARRGWLQNLETNEAGRNALAHTGWNRYRIECVGPWVRTWINDVPIVDYLDAKFD